ncbi:MAG: hypothetical protein ACRD3W_21685 [Terriglobales bacterium]
MRNIFLVYMPPGNAEAMVHYEDTIKTRVPISRVAKFLSQDARSRLDQIFGGRPMAVWGSAGGRANRAKFDRMQQGDEILIVEGNRIKLIGHIALKLEDADISRELWKPLRGNVSATWELVYFIANPRELDVPFVEFNRLFEYSDEFRLRGLTTVAENRLERFYARFDDLYSVLVRIKSGEPVATKPALTGTQATEPSPAPPTLELESDDVDELIASPEVSDHAKMQWKLARLGLKAGERVWIPTGDQTRLRKLFDFDQCDREFAAGIDLPHSYVENIDVVWKQEFRIDAAYEVENSTAIYSGLLRFADLTTLAPNTIYPMFIVAQAARKGQVRDQLRRPAFRQLKLSDKVRFLSYETVDEIDGFFSGATSGLNVDLVSGKAEVLL